MQRYVKNLIFPNKITYFFTPFELYGLEESLKEAFSVLI